MSVERELRQAAREAAEQAQNLLTQLEHEVLDLGKRLAEAKAKCDAARPAPKRLANYPVTLGGGDYACPVCWINGTESALQPISSGNEDLLRCRACGNDFTVEYFKRS